LTHIAFVVWKWDVKKVLLFHFKNNYCFKFCLSLLYQ